MPSKIPKFKGTNISGADNRNTVCEFCAEVIREIPVNINYFTIHKKCYYHMENIVNEYNKQAIIKERFG